MWTVILAPYCTVLVLGGIELIFYTIPGMVLHLGFRMKITLIIHQCCQLLLSSAYTESRFWNSPLNKCRIQKAKSVLNCSSVQ